MNNDEFTKLLLTIEGLTRAVLDVRDELEVMNKEGIILLFTNSSSLEN